MESFHQVNDDDDDNSMLHEENKNENKKKNLGITPIIISPKKSKESRMTIRAHKAHQEGDSITSKIGHLFGSFKEKTTDYAEKVQTKHQDINSFATTKIQAGTTIEKEKEGGQQQFVIPIIEENYNISKKTFVEDVKIEKRWIVQDEKIHLPIAYEKIFVDDKELDSYSREDIFSQIKGKIINFQYIGENDEDKNKIEKEKKDDIKRQQNEKDRQQVRVKEDEIPLFDDDEEKPNSTSFKSNNEVLNDKTQKVIPLYAEQLIITKKKVKIGEILITKKKVIEEKKVNIDIAKERVTIEYPNGKKERLTEK
jgi:stress response protein YsnF